MTAEAKRLRTAAVVLGIGFGGLFDGIVFHQILQWNHMLSTPAPPVTVEALQLKTLADGLYDVAFLVWGGMFVAVGSWLTARNRQVSA